MRSTREHTLRIGKHRFPNNCHQWWALPKLSEGNIQKALATRLGQTLNARIIAFDELDVMEKTDHAGWYETSMFCALGGEVRYHELPTFPSCQQPSPEALKNNGLQCLERIRAYFEDQLGPG